MSAVALETHLVVRNSRNYNTYPYTNRETPLSASSDPDLRTITHYRYARTKIEYASDGDTSVVSNKLQLHDFRFDGQIRSIVLRVRLDMVLRRPRRYGLSQ